MADFIVKTQKILLLIGDLVIFYISLILTLLLRFGPQRFDDQLTKHFLPFTLIFIIWLIVFYIGELYELKFKFYFTKTINSLIKLTIANFVLAIVIFYFLSPFIYSLRPQRVLIIEILIAFALILGWRVGFSYLFKGSRQIKVLIIGKSELSDQLINEIKNKPHLGYQSLFEESLPDNIKEYCKLNKTNVIVTANEINKNANISKKII